MENTFKVEKIKSQRKGFEHLHDFFLVWTYNDKVYRLRIKPAFNSDYKLLLCCSDTLEAPIK